MRGNEQVEDVTANECAKTKSTEVLFNFLAYLSFQLEASEAGRQVCKCVHTHMSGGNICCPGLWLRLIYACPCVLNLCSILCARLCVRFFVQMCV